MPRHDHSQPLPRRKTRRYNVRRIKATWPYSVQEIAELFGIHKNAVLRWLKQGLRADRSQRPYLIRGDELARFLNERQNAKRQRCGPDEFFCFRCRVPREACLGIADIAIESPTRLRIKALCATCDTPVNKVQSVRELAKIKQRFNRSFPLSVRSRYWYRSLICLGGIEM
jgi:excisionase family DNA binding protein